MPGFNIGGGNNREPSNTIEAFRNHRWRIMSLGADGTTGGVINSDKLVFAKSLQLPEFNVEEEMVTGAAIKYKFAKIVNWGDVVVTFYDVSGVYDGIMTWQGKVYSAQTGIGVADDYKKESRFQMTNGQGTEDGPLYVLKGSWPKVVNHSTLSYEDTELKLINLTLSYDWAEIRFLTRAQ
jgi:hypothetical protein